ncbi:MAG TPA: 4Fe-4S binding protein [Candidatus Obscuribacterales bacterium]
MLGLSLLGRARESLYQVYRGLKTVAMHTFREPTTQEYPDVMPDTHIRGRLALTVNPETGEHLCISCRQCERVCPDKCIEITAHKSPETNKLELIEFKIDHGLCMFCGLCTEVCPTNCIINTNDFEMSDYTREALVYDLRKLTLSQEESGYYFAKKELPMPKPKPAKAAPAAAAGAAKPAAGAAAAAKPAEGEGAKPKEGEAAKPKEGEAAKPAAAEGGAEKPAAAKPAEGESAKSKEGETAKPAAAGGEAAKPETAKPAEGDVPKSEPASSEAKPEAKEPEKSDKAADKPSTDGEKKADGEGGAAT